MSFLEGLRLAFESIVANPLRSFLTLLGIVIGVCAIIAVISVIHGLNLYVEERIIKLGPASFELNRFGIITSMREFVRAIQRNPPLRMSDGNAIRERCTLVDLVGMKAEGSANVRYRRKTLPGIRIKAVTPEILVAEPYEIAAGRAIAEEDQARAASVAFLGYAVAEELFGGLDPIGKEVKLDGRSFEVIGSAQERGTVFGMSRDNYVLVPLSSFQKSSGSRTSIAIVARARDPAALPQAMDEARVVLRARHHLRYEEEDDFGIVSAEGMNALWQNMTRMIFQVALFVVGISLVVGGIVIMNIMLVAVIERTREIGIRKALGARHRDIRRQFLLESALLASVGGLVGVALAYGATLLLRTFTPFPAAFPWWAPLLALSLSSAIGIFFGLYPAARAARLHPIEALRKD